MVKGISAESPTSGDGAAGALAVIGTLYGMIQVGMQAGPCFNPAVAIAFISLEIWQTTNSNNIYSHYVFDYTVGPAVGGLLAGAFSILLRKTHDSFDFMQGEKHRRTGVTTHESI